MIHTFAVVTEAHLSLAETNGVFSGGNAIEFLQLGLVNALVELVSTSYQNCRVRAYLAGKVDLNGLDANVLRSSGHLVCMCTWMMR